MSLLSNLVGRFRDPTTLEIAKRELREAQRTLLIENTRLDYALSQVKYNKDRVDRLKEFLKTPPEDLV